MSSPSSFSSSSSSSSCSSFCSSSSPCSFCKRLNARQKQQRIEEEVRHVYLMYLLHWMIFFYLDPRNCSKEEFLSSYSLYKRPKSKKLLFRLMSYSYNLLVFLFSLSSRSPVVLSAFLYSR